MSYYTTKLILGSVLFLSGFAATVTMLTVMGKAEKKLSTAILRKIHKIAGFIFFLLLITLTVMGTKFWSNSGDQISFRAVLHAVLAGSLFIIFFLKVSIVRFYKQLLKMAPSLGLTVFCLSFVVFFISGGYYGLRLLHSPDASAGQIQVYQTEISGRIDFGRRIFENKCATCHRADSEEKTIGPGFKGLLKKATLPHSGRPATVDNILKQLKRPVLTMPAFTNLTEQKLADLIAYLHML
ncbi:MAG: cytochrome c [Candidatus Aminicenantes bacterium]|nr:cytochrome c [Candidatus Aminicenantes bacterium]